MFHLEVSGDVLDAENVRWRNLSPVLREFAAYMQQQTDLQFERGGGPGSALGGGQEFRGVRWEAVSRKYRRRPSGKAITPLSALLQDTGTLRKLVSSEIVRVTPSSLVMGTRLPYAAYQDARRPILFMTDHDADKLVEMLERHYSISVKGSARSPSDTTRSE